MKDAGWVIYGSRQNQRVHRFAAKIAASPNVPQSETEWDEILPEVDCWAVGRQAGTVLHDMIGKINWLWG